jgi:hypothetical protein
MRRTLLMLIVAALPGLAAADYCAERADAALTELAGVLQPTDDGANTNRAREVLMRMCREARGEGVAQAEEAAAQAKADAETTELFGVEIKQAPEGAAGYERARKTP